MTDSHTVSATLGATSYALVPSSHSVQATTTKPNSRANHTTLSPLGIGETTTFPSTKTRSENTTKHQKTNLATRLDKSVQIRQQNIASNRRIEGKLPRLPNKSKAYRFVKNCSKKVNLWLEKRLRTALELKTVLGHHDTDFSGPLRLILASMNAFADTKTRAGLSLLLRSDGMNGMQ